MPIEYAPGGSWNVLTGCKHTLAQCPVVNSCWARSMAHRFPKAAGGDFQPRFHPDRLEKPYYWKKPRRVAACFMGDLFGDWTRDMFGVMGNVVADILVVVRQCPQHTFLLLTKNSERLADFNPWPDNAWVGVSAWDEDSFKRALVNLEDVKARHTWVSVEPMQGPIPATSVTWSRGSWFQPSWVVIGGLAQGQQHHDLANWVNDLAEDCRVRGIPYWEKRGLSKILQRPLHQELPKA